MDPDISSPLKKLELAKPIFQIRECLKNGVFLFFLLCSLIQGAGWNLISGASNLDISSVWLLGESLRDGRMENAGHITVFGPLGFLDWNFLSDGKLLLFSTIFRIVAISFLFWVSWELLRLHPLTDHKNGTLSLILTTFIAYSQSPATVLFFGMIMTALISIYKNVEISKSVYASGVLLISILFLVKLLYFSFAAVAFIYLYLRSTKPRYKEFLTDSMLFLCTFLFSIGAILAALGFTAQSALTWMRGYLEMSRGYGDMYGEEVGRIWEYPAFLILTFLIVLILIKTDRNFQDIAFVLILLFIAFRYGFTRHDGHSALSFKVIFVIAFTLMSICLKALSRVTTLIALVSFVISANFSFISFLDVTSRINSFGNYIKLVDYRYLAQKKTENNSQLISVNALPEVVLNEIGQNTVAILPWPITVDDAYQFTLAYPPQPQLFAAYTNWLDNANRLWISGPLAPRYILEPLPVTIDGRNPNWDSPRFQIERFCRYKEVKESSKWLLSEKLMEPRCNLSDLEYIGSGVGELTVTAEDNAIILVKVESGLQLHERIINTVFKPLVKTELVVDSSRFRFINSPDDHNIIAAGASIDRPGLWKIGSSHTLRLDPRQSVTLYKLQVKQD
jgi:hypothetical protein